MSSTQIYKRPSVELRDEEPGSTLQPVIATFILHSIHATVLALRRTCGIQFSANQARFIVVSRKLAYSRCAGGGCTAVQANDISTTQCQCGVAGNAWLAWDRKDTSCGPHTAVTTVAATASNLARVPVSLLRGILAQYSVRTGVSLESKAALRRQL